MPEILLTFYCATADCEHVAEALRTVTMEPIHVREEQVYGRDFDDAHAAEQVRGALRRSAVDVVTDDASVDILVAKVEGALRSYPVRWQTVMVGRRGRIV